VPPTSTGEKLDSDSHPHHPSQAGERNAFVDLFCFPDARSRAVIPRLVLGSQVPTLSSPRAGVSDFRSPVVRSDRTRLRTDGPISADLKSDLIPQPREKDPCHSAWRLSTSTAGAITSFSPETKVNRDRCSHQPSRASKRTAVVGRCCSSGALARAVIRGLSQGSQIRRGGRGRLAAGALISRSETGEGSVAVIPLRGSSQRPSRGHQEPPMDDARECRGTNEGAANALRQFPFPSPGW
jgi:hypothetical protein